jgi:hypothetical protein
MCNVTLWPLHVTIDSIGNATLVSFIADLYVSVNKIEVFSVAVEKLELIFFALLSSFETFHTAVNNINVRESSCKVPDIFVRF